MNQQLEHMGTARLEPRDIRRMRDRMMVVGSMRALEKELNTNRETIQNMLSGGHVKAATVRRIVDRLNEVLRVA